MPPNWPALGRRRIGNPTIHDVTLFIDLENTGLIELLEQISQAHHDHLVRHDQHAATRIVQTQCIERAAQPQNHIAPAFTAGWTVIKLANLRSQLRLVREQLHDAGLGEAIQNAKLALA